MKKLFCFFMAICCSFLLVFVSACSNQTDDNVDMQVRMLSTSDLVDAGEMLSNARAAVVGIAVDYPDSYYALRAFGRKSSIEGKKDFMWKSAYFENIDEELFVDSMKQTAQELKSKYGNFIAELAVVDDFDTILLIDDKDKIFLSLSALKKGQGASSCFYAIINSTRCSY